MSEREARPDPQDDDGFVPRGAIAFMVLMILAYAATWFLLFFLMVGRP